MGMTYTYDTRKITRDFHLLKPDGKSCTKSNLPPGVHCIGCQFYTGEYSAYDYEKTEWKTFIKCKLPGISDHESARSIVRQMYEKFETEALEYLCQ